MIDVAIVGAGLIGSAAARHLAEAGCSVVLFGPSAGNDQRVHASHFDEARITRFIGPDPVWAALARAAIGRYADIEVRSGVRFHTPCGHLRIDLPTGHPRSVLPAVQTVADGLAGHIETWNAETILDRFPALSIAGDASGHWDPAPAGLIHPLRLIEAQHRLVQHAGGTLDPSVIHAIRAIDGGFELVDHCGHRHRAARVVVTAGAYSSRFQLTPHLLALDVRPETVLLVETPDDLREQLGLLPGMIWNFDPLPHRGPGAVDSVYILPPVRYPDGRWYLKIGADHDRDQDVSSREAMHAYMSGPGSAATARDLQQIIERLIPATQGAATRTKPCLLTYSPHGRPMIDEVAPGWFVAVAGCGKSAKSSDQSGKLAADLVLGRSWEGFVREDFQAVGA
jgi:glycine/D-amino acid oxidase-like deaminating enzyme